MAEPYQRREPNFKRPNRLPVDEDLEDEIDAD
jgi:hypothetical protein